VAFCPSKSILSLHASQALQENKGGKDGKLEYLSKLCGSNLLMALLFADMPLLSKNNYCIFLSNFDDAV
jgi:hypothetical protein